ncbi:hypothetical protein PcP3B5_46080 [Pseudomonas citronellolis]|nr:hypothetical protein PcP3B5_46080 [Pseudomonas citronellolis]
MKDKRFTLKFLGAFMESVNIKPAEFRKNLWHAALAIGALVLIARLPELITAIGAISR